MSPASRGSAGGDCESTVSRTTLRYASVARTRLRTWMAMARAFILPSPYHTSPASGVLPAHHLGDPAACRVAFLHVLHQRLEAPCSNQLHQPLIPCEDF